MKLVKENLLGSLNENMQQAKSILKKLKIPELDPRFQDLKQILLNDNAINYIGQFTKWIFKERASMEEVMEVYQILKEYPGKVPPINTFETPEKLYDFLQGSQISDKVSKAIKALKKRLVYFNLSSSEESELAKLLELNIKHIDSLTDFYNKKGRKFNSFDNVYKETKSIITNLEGDFNLPAILRKIDETGAEVKIVLKRPDILVLIPLNYEASCKIGSRSWCIVTSQSQWNNYATLFNNQYYIFDFTKQISDNKSMIGATIDAEGKLYTAHFKDDSRCSDSYLDQLFKDE